MRITILLILSTLCHASTASMDGNDLLKKCASWWGVKKDVEKVDYLDTGFCAGYLAGVMDVEAMWKGVEDKESKSSHYCKPEEVTNGQVLQIIKKWLNDSPDKLHWRADTIIHQALLAAFPCK